MIRIKTYYLFVAVFIGLIIVSCGKESSCFKGTGKIISEQRSVSASINSIAMEDNIDLVLTQSNELSLRVEGGANMLPFVHTEVSGNELRISSTNRCGLFRDYSIPITVYLSVPNIETINYSGQGSITSSNALNFPNFEVVSQKGTGSINLMLNSTNVSIVQHTGPADVTLTGNANNLYLYSGGNGWFYFKDLSADNVHTNNAGTGDFIVKANNSLLVELTSYGNIDYYGNPNVTVSTHTGKGLLRKK